MSLDEKIGQMLVIGFKGNQASEELKELIQEYHIGGVILFSQDVSEGLAPRNVTSPEQLTSLISSLQELSRETLLVSIDQEGGAVQRLRVESGFVGAPSPQYLGEINNLDSTRYYAVRSAEELIELGVNVNFVPCVDLNINPENPVIGARGRAFSDSVAVVIDHAAALVEEYSSRGVITSLKHFPGHGSSLVDSHLGLTEITDSWSEGELEPYRALIEDNKADIVMVGHLFNRELDTLYPASLSQATIDGLLRGELGYDGVVATDDMNMGAITENYTFEHALELAINAGVDMIIIGNNGAKYEEDLPQRCINHIRAAVDRGVISEQRIDEAYQRIMRLKRERGMSN